jgi:hypothetical protein
LINVPRIWTCRVVASPNIFKRHERCWKQTITCFEDQIASNSPQQRKTVLQREGTPTTSSDIDMKNGCLDSCSKNPIPRCPTKSASKAATKHKSDKKQIPTSSSGANCAEEKACKVMKSALDNKLVLMPSTGMSGRNGDEKKERRVMSAPRQSKTAVQQTGSTNGGSSLAKAAENS